MRLNLIYKILTKSTPTYLRPPVSAYVCPHSAVYNLWVWVFCLSFNVTVVWAVMHSVFMPQGMEPTTRVYPTLVLFSFQEMPQSALCLIGFQSAYTCYMYHSMNNECLKFAHWLCNLVWMKILSSKLSYFDTQNCANNL